MNAQVGIGTTAPNASSELEIASPLNDKGVLIPRMTQAQRNLIASPATSLLIYQTDNTPGFYYYNGTIWVGITAGASTDWTLLGNAGTTSATNFFGTTDDNDIVFKRFNVRAGFIGNPNTSTGNRNTSFGANTLLTPSATGIRNVAIGTNVLPTNNNGNLNVAIGESSMFTNTNGTNNTAVGAGSLYSSQLGVANTAIGRNALTTLNGISGSQGSNNTAVGYEAIRNSTVGQDNTAIGRAALRNNSTGNSNVAIGYQSGLNNSGSNNITIGTNAEVPVLANSDQLSIGNVIYGTTMTSTAAGKIGIGESNPLSKLHVTYSGTDLNGIINSYSPTTDTTFNRTGINNSVSGSTNDVLVGQFNSLTNSGNGSHFGIQNNLTGTGTGSKVGTENIINAPNALTIYGTKTNLTGNLSMFGNEIRLLNNSTSTFVDIHGTSTRITGSAVGPTIGFDTEINTTGNGNVFGNNTKIYGTAAGTGTKYSNFNYINPTVGGTHFGVYSEVLKAGATNFAGYFLGNVGIGTNVANTYTLPSSRATSAGQIMQSNATGVVTWLTPTAALNSYAWLTTGNSGMTANFLGTTDANPLRFVASSTERMRIVPTGEVVVGSTTAFTGDKFSSYATGTEFAVRAVSTLTGRGIQGENTGSGIAVIGFNVGTGNAVQGQASGINANGTVGFNTAGTNTGTGSGLFGRTAQSAGFGSQSINTNTSGTGAFGSGNNLAGSFLISGSGGAFNGLATGVFANSTTNGVGQGIYTNQFGNVTRVNYWDGTTQYKIIGVGTVSTTARGLDGERVVLHCTEAPEIYFEDYGQGQLVDGRVHITIDPIIVKNITVNEKHPLRVYIQLEDDCNGFM